MERKKDIRQKDRQRQPVNTEGELQMERDKYRKTERQKKKERENIKTLRITGYDN